MLVGVHKQARRVDALAPPPPPISSTQTHGDARNRAEKEATMSANLKWDHHVQTEYNTTTLMVINGYQRICQTACQASEPASNRASWNAYSTVAYLTDSLANCDYFDLSDFEEEGLRTQRLLVLFLTILSSQLQHLVSLGPHHQDV